MQELRFEQDLVRALLREQHADLADLELRDVDGGWDNQQGRLGDELAVRLPRTERAPALLRTEQRWLPELAPRLPLPTPVPLRVGAPSSRFAHTWTVAPPGSSYPPTQRISSSPPTERPATRRSAGPAAGQCCGPWA